MAAAEFRATAGTVTATAGAANGIGNVIADTAVLVTDGATPTQAHVNTLNTDLTAALAEGDVIVYITSISNIADMNVFRQCLRRIETVVAGSGIFATGSGTPRQNT